MRFSIQFQASWNSQQRRDIHSMLAHRRRQWANIVPTLSERFVFAVMSLSLVRLIEVHRIIQLSRCLSFTNKHIFRHLKLEIALAIPALNE